MRTFDISDGDGGLYVNDNITPSDDGNGVSINVTTLPKKGVNRQDNPYTGQTPGVDDIQKLYNKSSNKKGTVTKVEVVN